MPEQRIETNKRARRSNVLNVRPINYDSWDALREKLVGMMASFDMRLVEYERDPSSRGFRSELVWGMSSRTPTQEEG